LSFGEQFATEEWEWWKKYYQNYENWIFILDQFEELGLELVLGFSKNETSDIFRLQKCLS